MAKNKGGRYGVTGPGIENVSYPDFGPALSRSVTEACKAAKRHEDVTIYVRDLDGEVLGYSEYFENTKMIVTTSHVPSQK